MANNENEHQIDLTMQGMSMQEIGYTIVANYLEGYRNNQRPQSVMIWGPPGCGKTFTVYDACDQIAKEMKIRFKEDIPKIICRAMLTSCMDPTDIQGPPFPVTVEGLGQVHSQYLPLEWGWVASKQYEDWYNLQPEEVKNHPSNPKPGPMVLFFDDIVAAHFQTQTAFFKVVHEGMVGALQLRDNVMIVAAGNRVDDNAGANDMPTALASRFEHCYAKQTTDDWLNWAVKKGKIHPRVVAYIRQHTSDLNEFNSEVATRDEKAFACSRTWEMVSKMLNAGLVPYENPLFSKRIMGIIGRGVGTQFLAFMRDTAACVNPEDIIKNPKKAKVPKAKNLDSLHATIASLEHYIRENNQYWKEALIYTMRDEMLTDLGVLLAKAIVDIIFEGSDEIREEALHHEAFEEMFEKYGSALTMPS